MDKSSRTRALGFIGGGLNSAVGYVHAAASQMDGLWRVEAGCFSRKQEENLRTAAHWQVAPDRVYGSWRDFLEKEAGRLDAVAILTPTPDHADMVAAALAGGLPVICEKALATSLEEVELIRRAYVPGKSFLAVTFNYSGYPMVRELRHLIRSGKLGKIQQVHLEMPQEGFSRVDASGKPLSPQAWRLQDYKIPTISLDLGVHLHHLMSFLTGQSPLEIMADQANYGKFSRLTDNVTCWVKYPDDVRCIMWYSKTALGHRNGLRLRVFGEWAGAEWYQLNPEELLINRADGTREIVDRGGTVEVSRETRYARFKVGHPAGFIEAFANLYADVARAYDEWEEGGAYESDFVFGLDHAEEGLALFEAGMRSAGNRSWEILRKSSGRRETEIRSFSGRGWEIFRKNLSRRSVEEKDLPVDGH
jgi:predicted dehydrogenase